MPVQSVYSTIAAGNAKAPSEFADIRISIDEENSKRWRSFPQTGKTMRLPANFGNWDMLDDELILANDNNTGVIQLFKVRPDFIDFVTRTRLYISGSGIFSRDNRKLAYVISIHGW